MTWQTQDLLVEQNSQWVQTFLFFNPDPSGMGGVTSRVPYDFTGATIKAQVRESEDPASNLIATFGTGTGEIVLTSGTTSPGPPAPAYNNGFTWTIAYTTSVTWTPGNYWYDLFMYNSGIPTRLVAGRFQVDVTQTR